MREINNWKKARRVNSLSGGDGLRVGKEVDVSAVGKGLRVDVGVGEVQRLVAQSFEKIGPGGKSLQVLPGGKRLY